MPDLTVFISFSSVLQAFLRGDLTYRDLRYPDEGGYSRFWFGCRREHLFRPEGEYPMELPWAFPMDERRDDFPGENREGAYVGSIPSDILEKFEEFKQLIRNAETANRVHWKTPYHSWTQEVVTEDGMPPIVIPRGATYPWVRDTFLALGARVWFGGWITRTEPMPDRPHHLKVDDKDLVLLDMILDVARDDYRKRADDHPGLHTMLEENAERCNGLHVKVLRERGLIPSTVSSGT